GLELKPPPMPCSACLSPDLAGRCSSDMSRRISPELPAGEELSATFLPVLARLGRARNDVLNLFL
ncbi:hypothetical protein A2U01_0078853, partial [Trifolium medium]|nr:hypothetical protein [Trifolium medium]